MPTVFGAEITLTPGLAPEQQMMLCEEATTTQVATGRVPDSHAPDPHGDHLLLLADGPAGYGRLARTLSLGHLAGEKGAPQFTLADVARNTVGDVWALTGCRKGAVTQALLADGPTAARRELQRLIDGVRARPGPRRAVGPRRSARLGPQRRLGRAGHALRRRLHRHDQRPLRHAGPAPPGHRPRRCACSAQPRRARPVAPGGGGRPPPLGGRAAAPLRPLPRRRRAGRRGRPGRRLRPLARRPVAPAVPMSRRVDRDGVPATHRRGRGPPPLRRTPAGRRRRDRVVAGPGVADDRSRAGDHRAARLRRLLPRRVGPRRVLPALRHHVPGPGERGQLRRLLRHRRHRRRCRVARPAVRALPVAGARRPAGHRHRHRE